jgi:hypothetical protein
MTSKSQNVKNYAEMDKKGEKVSLDSLRQKREN